MLGLALTFALALAQPTREPQTGKLEASFARLDSDENGSLDEEELSILARAQFERLDTNADGVVDLDEFRELGVGRDATITFRRLDADGDGHIAESEIPESLRPRFAGADRDGNGFIDFDEVEMMAVREREARATSSGPSGLMRRLMELDLDGDGRLHRDELPEAMEYLRKSFDELDLDGDGYLDGSEIRAMTEQPLRWRYSSWER